MENDNCKGFSMSYSPRFGRIAVDMGFATEGELKEVLAEQIANSPSVRLRPHKLIGEIFFEKGWMNLKQIEIVLTEVSRNKFI